MLPLFKAAARALSFRFAAAFFLPLLGGMVAVCGKGGRDDSVCDRAEDVVYDER